MLFSFIYKPLDIINEEIFWRKIRNKKIICLNLLEEWRISLTYQVSEVAESYAKAGRSVDRSFNSQYCFLHEKSYMNYLSHFHDVSNYFCCANKGAHSDVGWREGFYRIVKP